MLKRKLQELSERMFPLKTEWPEAENFALLREGFIAKMLPEMLQKIQHALEENKETYSTEQVQKLGTCLSHFLFGIVLLHKRQGKEFSLRDLQINDYHYSFSEFPMPFFYVKPDADRNQYTDKKDVFLVILSELITLFDPQTLRKFLSILSLDTNMNLDDLMVLTGVEEAAHRFFSKRNKQLHIRVQDEDVSTNDYHASDEEFHALLWKMTVARKYFPHYLEAFTSRYRAMQKKRQEIVGQKGESNMSERDSQ